MTRRRTSGGMTAARGRATTDESLYTPADPLISGFVTALHFNRGRSPRTCEAYARDLEMFAGFLGEGLGLTQASRTDVNRFVLELRGKRRYRANAVRRKLVALRRFYRYLVVEGLREDDPMTGIEPPKAEKRLPVVLKEAQVARLLRTRVAGRSDFQRLRDHAMLELLYASGIRRAELAGLNLQDVDLERKVMRVIGKGNKERVVFFNSAAGEAMHAYLGLRPRTADEAFFVGRYGKRLGVRHIWAIFKEIQRLSGVAVNASPHVMRHSFATHLLENGADLMTIKELLGHASIASTQVYTNLSMAHVRKVYDASHPRDRQRDR